MKTRRLSFEEAKTLFAHRYTMEHVPEWARVKCQETGKYYAPQYATDREWYENTLFEGESELARRGYCHSSAQSWPLGKWLDKPFTGKEA